MSRPSIYSFGNHVEYLKVAGLQALSRRNKPITLEKWASTLGYKSPRSVAMVLKGQRLPSQEMLERISSHFGHSESEHRYLELLVRLEKYRQQKRDTRGILEELNKLHPVGFNEPNIDAKLFAYIADWYHFAIKQLIGAPGFRNDPAWISKKLRGKATESEVRNALRTMLELGIIEKNKQGMILVKKKRIMTTQDIPDQALRLHHKGMISRALESVDGKDFDNRELTSITLRIDPKNICSAKQAIRKFRESFHSQFESESSAHVYQLNFQLFEHTVPEFIREEKSESH